MSWGHHHLSLQETGAGAHVKAGGGGPQGTNVFEHQGLYEKEKFKVEVSLKGNRKS